MTEFIKQYGAVYVTALFCVMEILSRGMLSHTYRRLIRAAEDMGRSDHRLMKSLRMKFDTFYRLKIGVADVNIFVERYLQHYRVLGLRLRTWESVGNLCMLLSMITGLGGAVCAMAMELDRTAVFSSLFAGIFGNGLILAFDCLYEIQNKRELLRIDMMDFLANIYKPRLENETFHAQMVEEYQKEYFEGDDQNTDRKSSGRTNVGKTTPNRTTHDRANTDKVVKLLSRGQEKRSELPIEFTAEEEEVIMDVIREYMG